MLAHQNPFLNPPPSPHDLLLEANERRFLTYDPSPILAYLTSCKSPALRIALKSPPDHLGSWNWNPYYLYRSLLTGAELPPVLADDVVDLLIHGLMQLHEPIHPPPAAVDAIWRFSPEGSAMRCLMVGFVLWHIQQGGRAKGKWGGQNPWIERAVVKLLDKNEGLMRAVARRQKVAKEQGEKFEFPLMVMWGRPCKWHGHTVAVMEYECPVQKRKRDLDEGNRGKVG